MLESLCGDAMRDWFRKWWPFLLAAGMGAIIAAAIGAYLALPGPAQGLGTVAGGLAGSVLRWLFVERRVRLEHELRVFEEQSKTVHGYVETYYLPFIVRVQELAGTLGCTPLNEEECLFYLANLYCIDKKWMDETPVLLLTDRVGENVIRSIERRFHNVVSQHLSKEDRGQLIKQTKIGELYVDWVDKVKARGSLHTTFSQKFRPWIRQANREELATWLHTLAKLFLFEINMCYSSWYGKSATKPTAGEEKIDENLVATILNELVSRGDIDESDKRQYLKKIGIHPQQPPQRQG